MASRQRSKRVSEGPPFAGCWRVMSRGPWRERWVRAGGASTACAGRNSRVRGGMRVKVRMRGASCVDSSGGALFSRRHASGGESRELRGSTCISVDTCFLSTATCTFLHNSLLRSARIRLLSAIVSSIPSSNHSDRSTASLRSFTVSRRLRLRVYAADPTRISRI